MAAFRVGPLPEGALAAAAEFYSRVLPRVRAQLNPPRNGEGDHSQHGGGGPAEPQTSRGAPSVTGLRPAPPPRPGEDLVLVFDPASYDHRGWRLTAVQDLAREAAPRRVNAVAGDDEQAVLEAIAWLEQAPGITGQLLAVDGKSAAKG